MKITFGNIQFKVAVAYLTICFVTMPISYFFCVDKTKYANTQTAQIALNDPGTKVCMYKNIVRDNLDQSQLNKYIFGSEEVILLKMLLTLLSKTFVELIYLEQINMVEMSIVGLLLLCDILY